MTPPNWITLYEAYTRLQNMYLSLRVHEIVETGVKSGQRFVRGIRVSGIGLQSSYEIIGERISRDTDIDVFGSAIRDILEGNTWTNVQVDWGPFLAYVQQNLIPSGVQAASKAAGRKPTGQDKVRAYVEETYQGQIPPHVTNDEIASAVGVHERTVRRVRGRK